ncbi:uncharacterized protein LOC141693366 isoform X2 [Apium graveolens]|uniref:uncharacterized protein LOC141693366 isoform X2 n=1 Tax=Apium graveolens TaxID=4045 RepID=UPI003D7B4831
MKFPQGFSSMSGAGGYWDRFINGDDLFHNIINVLDFPLESVGEDKCAPENWEPQFQSLGPLNSESLQGLAPVFNSVNAEDTHNNFVQNDADRKQFAVVTETSSTHVRLDSIHPRKTSLFQTPSPNYVIECSSSCSAGKNLPTCPELLVPVKTRTKIPRRSAISRWHLISPLSSFKKTSNSNSKKKIKKLSQLPNDSMLSEDCNHQHMPSKRCVHCQAVKTPQWRDGPMGPKTLCNACGVRYQCGSLLLEYHPTKSHGWKNKMFSCSRGEEKIVKQSNEMKVDSTNQLQEDTSNPLSRKLCTQCNAKDGPVSPSTFCTCGVRSRSGRLLRKTRAIASQDSGRNERMNTRNLEKKKKELPGLPHDSEPVGVSSHQHGQARRCAHCQVTKTPQWRDGPMGPKTLCNACGVRYRMGRLLPEYRPIASPTFVPSLHSNLHKKVIKMRAKPIPEIIKPEMDPAMFQPPETVSISNNIENCM